MGKAMMGTGEASGEGRSVAAAEAAIANPLIDDVSLKGAKGLIINITGGNDITLYEVDEAANRIKQEVDENANIIYGTTCDDRLEGVVRVSIVATGIDVDSMVSSKPLEFQSNISINNSVYKQNIIEENASVAKNYSYLKSKTDDTSNESEQIHENNEDVQEDKIVQSDSYLETDIDKEEQDINEEEEKEKYFAAIQHEEKESESEYNNFIPNHSDNSDKIINEEKDEISAKLDPQTDAEVKTSVRKLSLFDTFDEKSSTESSSIKSEELKSEPVFENQIENEDNDSKPIEKEFEPDEQNDEEDEFNQETEDELLDIPTFLRRQAN